MPLVYEINTRCWLRDLSSRERRPINLSNVPDSEFAEWQRLGFTHLWLMGVWSSGPRSRAVALAVDDLQKTYGCSLQSVQRADIVGSPYAVSEYRVARQLGGSKGLQKFRAKLHRHGLKLLLDFVPNHVGLDHPWLNERPELFVQSSVQTPGTFARETDSGVRWIAHGKDPNFAPWSDTAQLDYRNPATREAMIAQLIELTKCCDGVRCDMAMLVLNEVFAKTWKEFPLPENPVERWCSAAQNSEAAAPHPVHAEIYGATEFWSEAIRALRKNHPQFLFIAEAYWGLEPRLCELGFDFAYNKELYDDLVRREPGAVQKRLLNATVKSLSDGVHFLENHDEARAASLFSELEHRAAAALVLSLPGMRLLHDGQLTGARFKCAVQLSCRPTEPVQPAIRDFYERLIAALKELPIETGNCRILPPADSGENVVMMLWRANGPDFWLVCVNLDSQPTQVLAQVPSELRFNADWLIEDLLESPGARATIAATGISLALPPWDVRILKCAPKK